MSKEINFLRDRQKIFSKRQKQDTRVLRLSGIVFGVLLAISLLIFGFRFFLYRRITNLTSLQSEVKANILSKEDIEQLFVVNVYKLKALTGINKKRRNKQEAIDYFSQVFGQDVLVKQIEYSGGDNLLTFRLQSKDVFVLENVLQKLESDEIKQRFISTTSSDLRRNKEGQYEISVAVVLKAIDS